MRRREFVALLGGAAAAWSVAAHAQQPGRMRHVGVLMGYPETDVEIQRRIGVFRQSLQELGWAEERNLKLHVRLAGSNPADIRAAARDIVELAVDVILSSPGQVTLILRDLTGSIPIVFANVPDPVGIGLVPSLARPGGNLTGVTSLEPALAGKWLEVLKEIAPQVVRVGIVYNPDNPAWRERLGVIAAIAPALDMQLVPIGVQDTAELEHRLSAFSAEPETGLIVFPGIFNAAHREKIAALAARQRLPAVYAFRFFVAAGGLISYGIDADDQFRRAASYVDRILKGEKAGELPVEAPTKFELVVNLKAAKAIELTVPPSLLARADEVIE